MKTLGTCPEHGPQTRAVWLGKAAYCPVDGCPWSLRGVTDRSAANRIRQPRGKGRVTGRKWRG